LGRKRKTFGVWGGGPRGRFGRTTLGCQFRKSGEKKKPKRDLLDREGNVAPKAAIGSQATRQPGKKEKQGNVNKPNRGSGKN